MFRKKINIYTAILKGKDEEVLSYLYNTLLPKVRKYIMTNNGNKEDADDIFQDVVIEIYRKIKTNNLPEINNIEGYLFFACKNTWINKVKKKTNNLGLDVIQEIEDNQNTALQEIIENEKSSAFNKLFSQVGERCKELLINVIFNHLTMEEIAKKMNFTNANAAKTQHYRCKQKISEMILNDPILMSKLR